MSSVFARALSATSPLNVAALVAMVLLAGCHGDETTSDSPTGQRLNAEVVALDITTAAEDAEVPHSAPPAISPEPIDIAVLAGWQAGQESDEEDEPRDPGAVVLPQSNEDMSYVSWLGDTGCHPATDVSLWRDGDDLGVEVEVPEDPETVCEAHSRAYVQFEVATDAVEGATTVDGVEIFDATGPGELVETIDLGQAWQMPSDAPENAALGLHDAAGAELSEAIGDSDADNVDDAAKALESEPESQNHRYAFLLHGCASDDATLVVAPGTISAEFDSTARCEQQSFVLAMFDIDQSLVNDEMTPMLHGHPA